MARYYSTLLCILISVNLCAQVRLSGTVRDSVGKPIDIANIIAVNQTSKVIESFSITDAKGHYRLNLRKNTPYKLTVSYLGMGNLEIDLPGQETDLIKDFVMIPDARSLEELTITRSIPIQISGDTLTYDAESFKNASDRKLEDVLKRLPGVEVTQDGEIKVEGKTVREIKIEGKRFFDGSTTLASKNIPADVLDKIQVLKNQDPVSQLSDVRDNSENVLINIKLKAGKQNFWFGELAAGGGPQQRYLLNPKLFYYSPQRSANVIVNMNNIGDAPLSSNELGRFSASPNEVHRRSGTSFEVDASEVALALRNNMARSAQNRFAAANLNYSPSPFWDLTGYAIYAGSNIHTQENAFRQFSQTASAAAPIANESTSSLNQQQNELVLFKLGSVYAPNPNRRLDYSAFGHIGKKQLSKDFHSSVLEDIKEGNRENPYKISQALNYYYTLDEDNIFAFESHHLVQAQDPFYNALIDRPELFQFAGHLGLDQSQSDFNLNQQKRIHTRKLDATLNYWHVINNRSNINFTLGALLSKQRFNSEIYQLLDNGSRFDPQDSQATIGNDITYGFDDLYLGIRYRMRAGLFIFEPAATLHTYHSRNQQLGADSYQQFYRLLPSFMIKAQLRSTEALQFNYRMTTRFTDVHRLAEGLVMNHYNTLFMGNRDLESTLSHDFNLHYNSAINQLSRFRYTLLNASLTYNTTVDAIRNRIDPQGVLQVSSPFNSNFADETSSAHASINRAFWRLVGGLGTTYSLSRYNQLFAGQVSRNTSFNQGYNISLKTNFSGKVPSASMGYNLSVNSYNLGTTNPRFYTDRFYVNMDASFLKGAKWTAEYDYNIYRNETQQLNSYSFLNAGLSYRNPSSQWESELRALNILNTKVFNRDTANEFYSISSAYFIQPRYLMLSVKYHL